MSRGIRVLAGTLCGVLLLLALASCGENEGTDITQADVGATITSMSKSLDDVFTARAEAGSEQAIFKDPVRVALLENATASYSDAVRELNAYPLDIYEEKYRDQAAESKKVATRLERHLKAYLSAGKARNWTALSAAQEAGARDYERLAKLLNGPVSYLPRK